MNKMKAKISLWSLSLSIILQIILFCSSDSYRLIGVNEKIFTEWRSSHRSMTRRSRQADIDNVQRIANMLTSSVMVSKMNVSTNSQESNDVKIQESTLNTIDTEPYEKIIIVDHLEALTLDELTAKLIQQISPIEIINIDIRRHYITGVPYGLLTLQSAKDVPLALEKIRPLKLHARSCTSAHYKRIYKPFQPECMVYLRNLPKSLNVTTALAKIESIIGEGQVQDYSRDKRSNSSYWAMTLILRNEEQVNLVLQKLRCQKIDDTPIFVEKYAIAMDGTAVLLSGLNQRTRDEIDRLILTKFKDRVVSIRGLKTGNCIVTFLNKEDALNAVSIFDQQPNGKYTLRCEVITPETIFKTINTDNRYKLSTSNKNITKETAVHDSFEEAHIDENYDKKIIKWSYGEDLTTDEVESDIYKTFQPEEIVKIEFRRDFFLGVPVCYIHFKTNKQAMEAKAKFPKESSSIVNRKTNDFSEFQIGHNLAISYSNQSSKSVRGLITSIFGDNVTINNGIGKYVAFPTVEEANIAFDKVKFMKVNGSQLFVERVKPLTPDGPQIRISGVGNISRKVLINSCLRRCGDNCILNMKLSSDKQGNFAIATLINDEKAQHAISRLNGFVVGEYVLKVELITPQSITTTSLQNTVDDLSIDSEKSLSGSMKERDDANSRIIQWPFDEKLSSDEVMSTINILPPEDVVEIDIKRHYFTGSPYCYLYFNSSEQAQKSLLQLKKHKLNVEIVGKSCTSKELNSEFQAGYNLAISNLPPHNLIKAMKSLLGIKFDYKRGILAFNSVDDANFAFEKICFTKMNNSQLLVERVCPIVPDGPQVIISGVENLNKQVLFNACLERCGDNCIVNMKMGPISGGYLIATFLSEDSAQYAISRLNGFVIGENVLKAELISDLSVESEENRLVTFPTFDSQEKSGPITLFIKVNSTKPMNVDKVVQLCNNAFVGINKVTKLELSPEGDTAFIQFINEDMVLLALSTFPLLNYSKKEHISVGVAEDYQFRSNNAINETKSIYVKNFSAFPDGIRKLLDEIDSGWKSHTVDSKEATSLNYAILSFSSHENALRAIEIINGRQFNNDTIEAELSEFPGLFSDIVMSPKKVKKSIKKSIIEKSIEQKYPWLSSDSTLLIKNWTFDGTIQSIVDMIERVVGIDSVTNCLRKFQEQALYLQFKNRAQAIHAKQFFIKDKYWNNKLQVEFMKQEVDDDFKVENQHYFTAIDCSVIVPDLAESITKNEFRRVCKLGHMPRLKMCKHATEHFAIVEYDSPVEARVLLARLKGTRLRGLYLKPVMMRDTALSEDLFTENSRVINAPIEPVESDALSAAKANLPKLPTLPISTVARKPWIKMSNEVLKINPAIDNVSSSPKLIISEAYLKQRSRTLYILTVENISKETIYKWCEEHVGQGTVTGITIGLPVGKRRCDFAYITFSSDEAAAKALQLLPKELQNRPVVVRPYPTSTTEHVVYVRGVDSAASSVDLWYFIEELIGQGQIVDVRIGIPHEGSEFNYAHVCLSNNEAVDRVIKQLSGKIFFGRSLGADRKVSDNSIVMLKPIDNRVKSSDIVHMCQHLVGVDAIQDLKLQKDKNGHIVAVIKFRTSEFTAKALTSLNGKTLFGKLLKVEHVISTYDLLTEFEEEKVVPEEEKEVVEVSKINLSTRIKNLFAPVKKLLSAFVEFLGV